MTLQDLTPKSVLANPKIIVDRLLGPSAFGNYVVGLFAAASIWVTLIVDLGRTNESVSLWLVAGSISMITAAVWLLVGRWFYPKFKTLKSAALLIIAIYALAGLIRNLTLDLICQAIGLTPPTDRILVSVSATVLLLVFANLTANRRAEANELHKSLLIDRQKLIWLGASYDEKVLQAQRELIRRLDSDLYPAIQNVLEKLKPAGASKAPDISNDLVNTVSSVVRPICDHLSESSDTIIEQLDEIATNATEVVRPDAKFSVRSAIRPNLTIAALLFIAASVSPALGKDSNFANFALLSGLAWLLVLLVKFTWPKKLDSVSANLGLAIVSAAYLAAYATAFFVMRSFDETSQTLLIQASFSVGAAVIIARLAFISQSRLAVQMQLKQQNDLLSQLISKLRRQIWLIRRNATWVLHGPIQSALISSAMTLAHDELTNEDRRVISERIESAVASLQDAKNLKPRLESSMTSIVNVWSRSCDVQWMAPPLLLEALSGDPDTTTCLVEIASEGVSNAIRHGRAKHVSVRFIEISADVVEVEVVDDGQGIAADSQPGHGSAMLDQVCLDWSRASVADGAKLTARVMKNSADLADKN